MDPRFCGSTTSLPTETAAAVGNRPTNSNPLNTKKQHTLAGSLHPGVLFWFMGLEWIYRYATVSDSGFLEVWLGSGATPSAA